MIGRHPSSSDGVRPTYPELAPTQCQPLDEAASRTVLASVQPALTLPDASNALAELFRVN